LAQQSAATGTVKLEQAYPAATQEKMVRQSAAEAGQCALACHSQKLWGLNITKVHRFASSFYSPDLAPSDCSLVDIIKDALRGEQFTSEELRAAAHECYRSTTRDRLREAIQKFPER